MLEVKIDNLQRVVDMLRQIVAGWDHLVGAVEALTHDHRELGVRADQLERDHQDLRDAHERLRTEYEASVHHAAELGAAHESLLREHEATVNALRELQEQHQAVLHDREYAVNQIEAVLRRFTS